MVTLMISERVYKFVKTLEAKPKGLLAERMLSLGLEPRPTTSTDLVGFRGYRRLKVGDFRVIYSIKEDVVRVVLVDNRGDDEVYRALKRLQLT
jgi:mRNA interferase RelE/StbE